MSATLQAIRDLFPAIASDTIDQDTARFKTVINEYAKTSSGIPQFKIKFLNDAQFKAIKDFMPKIGIENHQFNVAPEKLQLLVDFIKLLPGPSSYASIMETKLLDFRNSSFVDEKSSTIAKIANSLWFGCKTVITAVAQAPIAVCAVVETVAYGVLKLGSYVLKSEKEGYYTELLKSSAFTLLWTPAVFFYFNPCFIKATPPSDELVARSFLRL